MAEEEKDLEEELRQGYVEQVRGISLVGPWVKNGCRYVRLAGSVEHGVLIQAYKVNYLQIVQPPRVAYPGNLQPPRVALQGSLTG